MMIGNCLGHGLGQDLGRGVQEVRIVEVRGAPLQFMSKAFGLCP